MSRFGEPQNPDFQRLNASIGFDRRLWPQDVSQSRAHAAMLADRGIITAEERDELLRGLDEVERELSESRFSFAPDDEDIHVAIERRLTELVGPVGGKLHTARSRNDQVATDLAMYTRDAALEAIAALTAVMRAILSRAEEHLDWAMPGYTHLQRAQPVYLSHHLLAYFWMLERDRRRFAFAAGQTASLPLGAGALAGVNFDTDRRQVAAALGFEQPAANSIDAVSNRDFVLDYLNAAATCATHLSRLGAELVLWSSQEFGVLRATRRLELGLIDHAPKEEPGRRRAAAGQGAPRGRSPDRLSRRHARTAPHLQQGPAGGQGASVRRRRHARADPGGRARHDRGRGLPARAARGGCLRRADRGHRCGRPARPPGVPFRAAHGIVSGLVRTALDSGRALSALTPAELSAHSEVLDDEYYEVLAQRSWLESKASEGGTALPRVREQLDAARGVLEGTL